MPLDLNILGEGVYTPREAGRLLGVKAQDVLRWTRGSGTNEPLWNAYYQKLDDTTELNFADLIELRTVKALRKVTSLRAIRYASKIAEEAFSVERPFLTQEFKTDGSEILARAIEEEDEN